jgi:cyclopropane fatty-acyl-phospholipid synthase-like methyltransferase
MHHSPVYKLYDTKSEQYYSGIRYDYLEELKLERVNSILEIGCGNGSTGEYALNHGICLEYFGIELSEDAANIAKRKLTQVLVGNIEFMDLPWKKKKFDAIIMSEVLEHLVDPWNLIRRIKKWMNQDAIVLASSPNIANHKIIRKLILGIWELTEEGIMDKTHLRWFTPSSFKNMFEKEGFVVEKLASISHFTLKQKIFSFILLGLFDHLFWEQINLKARMKCERN